MSTLKVLLSCLCNIHCQHCHYWKTLFITTPFKR